MSIKLLVRDTAEKIAAGEVIERPASIVKELLDNAVDARASRIAIEIIRGGKDYIKISDNGVGIPFAELPVAFLRHATSKITSIDDLETLSTLGFRGEALPSIAAVSKIRFLSKPREQLTAGEIVFQGGQETSYEETGARDGTTVIVEEIFYNTPVRLKFLKSDNHEASLIGDITAEYALGNPHISFLLISDGKTIVQTSGNGKLRETLAEIWGKNTAAALIENDFVSDLITVDSFSSPFHISRGNRRQQIFFVNGRLVKNQLLHSAVEEPYRGVLAYKKHPLALINITIPATETDVNVHPSKTLIKFHDERAVFSAVRSAVNNSFKTANIISEQQQPLVSQEPQPTQHTITALTNRTPLNQVRETGIQNNSPYEQFEIALPYLRNNEGKSPSLFPLLKQIGVYKNSYILAEGNASLYLVDQHAAHERVLYESTLAKLQTQTMYSQQLLEPVIIELTPKSAVLMETILPDLTEMGFEISPFGGLSFIVQSIPTIFLKSDIAQVLLDIINDIDQNKVKIKHGFLAEKLACKSAVKLNHQLHNNEINKLLEDLSACEEPFRCPHGRPTIIEISDNQIQKWFKRILS